MILVLLTSLQKKKKVFNLHMKLDRAITHKVSFILFFFIVF